MTCGGAYLHFAPPPLVFTFKREIRVIAAQVKKLKGDHLVAAHILPFFPNMFFRLSSP
jgi:hypothetical protein